MESRLQEQIANVVEKLKIKSQDYSSKNGMQTGIEEIDTCMRGISPGELVVLSAQRNMKTSIALNIISQIAISQKIPSCYFSNDFLLNDIIIQLLCCNSKINLEDTYRGAITPDDFNKLLSTSKKISSAPLFLKHVNTLSIENVKNMSVNMKKKHGVKFIVVDFLHNLTCNNEFSSYEKFTGYVLRQLKNTAEHLNISILALYCNVEQNYHEQECLSGSEHFNILENNVDALLDVRENKKAVSTNNLSAETAYAEILFANKIGELKFIEVPYQLASMNFLTDSAVKDMDEMPF